MRMLPALSTAAGARVYLCRDCTAAIEEEIDRHYTAQLDELGDSDPELAGMVREFRDDEREHRDAALAAGAEKAPAYALLSGAIRLGCRIAIGLSQRI